MIYWEKKLEENLEDDENNENNENDEVTQAWKKDEYECNEMIKRMNL
jgi:3-methyladenine DNA glycosylase AlkC